MNIKMVQRHTLLEHILCQIKQQWKKLITVLRQFWEIDNSGVENLPAMTLEGKMVMEQAERSIKFCNG